MGSVSLIGNPSENEANLSSISQGSEGSEMNKLMNKLKLATVIIHTFCATSLHAKDDLGTEMQRLLTEANKGNSKSAIKYGQECMNTNLQAENNKSFSCSARDGFLVIKKVADLGHPQAQQIIGESYYHGIGVTVNFKDSFRYFYKSAVKGNSKSQRWVAEYYEWIGKAVTTDPIKAYVWYSIAKANESMSSDLFAKLIHYEISELNSKQLEEAQELAKACLDSNYKNCP